MLAEGLFGYLSDYLIYWGILLSLILHTWTFFRFFPRKKWPKSSLVLGNGLVFLCLSGFAAMGGESYFRFVAVETDSFGVSLPARRWFALHTKLNSLGCRDKEWSRETSPAVHRIAFVGDSFTYGWGVERVEDRFADRLQAKFDAYRPKAFEVMNVAKPGWDTGQQLQPIRDMIDLYGVDEIVLGYVANDIEKAIPTTPGFDPTRPPDSTFFNLDGSCLVDYLYRRIWLPRMPTVVGYHDWLADAYANDDIWREQQRRLHAIVQACREREVRIRVVLLPFLRTAGSKFKADHMHALLKHFFEANGVDVLDLLPAIDGQDANALVVNAQDAHPNQRAHKLFADEIWKAFYAEYVLPHENW